MYKTKIKVIILAITGTVFSVGVVYAANTITPTLLDYVSTPAHTSLQAFTPVDCTAMPTYSTLTLNDTRNNQDYRVRKMPDGKCWMIDNLKLSGATLTSADSDVTTDFTIPANPVQSYATHSNGVCVSSGVTAANGNGYQTCRGTSSVTATVAGDNLPFIAYSDPIARGAYDNCQTGAPGLDPNSLTGCGYLYGWYTATAGTGTYELVNGEQATASICPIGWRLPSGTSDTTSPTTNGTYVTVADMATLNTAMANSSIVGGTSDDVDHISNWQAGGPFAGSYSGYYGMSDNWTTDPTASFYTQGYHGYYWTSTAASNTNARLLVIDYNLVHPGDYGFTKYNGLAIRCVLDPLP